MSEEQKILGFKGEYRWLSNFWPATVHLDGVRYPTVGNAYQASKSINLADRDFFATCSPVDAKAAGQKIRQRTDWDKIKVSVMTNLNMLKYFQHNELTLKLINTGDAYIEETNNWGDVFWGVCDGQGQNMLGKILMAIRSRLVEIRGS